jgi:copper resistance protein C
MAMNQQLIWIPFAIALLCLTTTAEAHAKLDHSEPAAGSTVAASPGTVTLYFTEQLEPKFSGAEVRDAGGARVDTGTSVSGSVVRVTVKTLPAGNYSVAWHVLSVDTHKTKGTFAFRVGG